MTNAANQNFQSTMERLEAAFQVADIATFDVSSCQVGDRVADVLDDPARSGFDFIPVKDGRWIAGVLERQSIHPGTTASNCMHALDGSMLVSAEESLRRFIPAIAATSYRLVLHGVEVNGIVTRSDVLSCPCGY